MPEEIPPWALAETSFQPIEGCRSRILLHSPFRALEWTVVG